MKTGITNTCTLTEDVLFAIVGFFIFCFFYSGVGWDAFMKFIWHAPAECMHLLHSRLDAFHGAFALQSLDFYVGKMMDMHIEASVE